MVSKRILALGLVALALWSCRDAPTAPLLPTGTLSPPATTQAKPEAISITSQAATFRLATVVTDLEHPWGLAFLSKNEILVTEREGRLRLVYLSFAKPGPAGSTTAIVRGRLGEAGLEQVEEIFQASAWSTNSVHYGGRMVFDDQGYLYLTVGERGEMNRAQDPADHAGSTLRLHDDGRAPEDNPFAGRQGYRPEIYSNGHRNAQGMVYQPATREIWQNEHGPMGGDEINIIKAGANYGWPKVTFGKDYTGLSISERTEMPGLEPPVLHWTPSLGCSGLAVYTGKAFPQWQGNVFSGALALTHLRRVVFKNGRPIHEEELLKDQGERIRTVTQGPDDLLYLLTDSARGRLLRLEPARLDPAR